MFEYKLPLNDYNGQSVFTNMNTNKNRESAKFWNAEKNALKSTTAETVK